MPVGTDTHAFVRPRCPFVRITRNGNVLYRTLLSSSLIVLYDIRQPSRSQLARTHQYGDGIYIFHKYPKARKSFYSWYYLAK